MLVASSGIPAGVNYKDNFATATEATTSPPNSNTVTVAITTNANIAITKVSNPSPGPFDPGITLQYTMVVTSNGGSTANGVVLYDPIPSGASYISGSLLYDNAARTDQSGDDNAYYDAAANRVVFTLGDMSVSPDTYHTLKFSVKLDESFADGSTTVTNTGTASASNTASKNASAAVVIAAHPDLTLSKAAPSLVPYPLATLNGAHTATTTLTLNSPPGSRYFTVGDRIYVNGLLRVVASVPNTTSITVDQAVTAAGGTQVLPVIRYSLYYANAGTALVSNVTVKEILPTGLNYLAATPTPTTAPSFDTNGILTWNVGTLNPDASGSVIIYTRPTATGTYYNTASRSAPTVPSFPSNTVRTIVGALELDKSTSTPSIVNNPTDGADYATYVIRVRNPFTATSALGVQVPDQLPQGFTYASTTSAVITGTGSRTATVNPTVGDTNPTWGTWTIGANSTLTITFTALVAPTVPAGTYQNGVTAISSNVSVLPFDELSTTAEDVTVTVPADLKIVKGVTYTCLDIGCTITYDITVTNVGSSTATSATITDTWPAELDPPSSATATLGTYSHPTWTITGNIPANSSVVTFGANTYTCIQNHTSSGANQPPNATYWVLGGTGGVAWASGVAYTSASATLRLSATINSIATGITNKATISASTFQGGATDTNPSNDSSTISIRPTIVTLSGFRAYEDLGRVVVEWETSSEHGTAGFYLYRLDRVTGDYIRINRRLLPALLTSPQGGTYSLIDKGASVADGSLTYMLVEMERKGSKNVYGPFTIQVGGESVTGSLNPDIGNLTIPDNCTSGDCSTAKKKNSVSRITKSFDTGGLVFLGNTQSAMKQTDTGRDLFENYIRKAHGISDAKKTRLNALKEARKIFKALQKKRTGESLKISLNTDGLYYLSAPYIADLMGTTADKVKDKIKKNELAMSNQGQNVAYLPDDKNTGVYFYGEGIDSIFTNDNIYWLKKGKGLIMESLRGRAPKQTGSGTFTETVHAEEDTGWLPSLFMDPEADIWLWDYILAGYPPDDAKPFTVQAKGVADLSGITSPPSAILTVHLQGFSDLSTDPEHPDHHVVISINGKELGDGYLDGDEAKSLVFEFDQKFLKEGDNTVQVKGMLDPELLYSMFMVDSFDLTYQRTYKAMNNSLLFTGEVNHIVTVEGFDDANILVFDVTNPKKPRLNKATTIAGTTGNYTVSFVPGSPDAAYLAITSKAAITSINAWADSPSGLSSPINRADYVVIAPEELASAAQSLANYRQSTFKTKVVMLEDIMDEFNYGISSPKAIHNFLSYAYQKWSKPPKYVVLAGDGTYDYKNIKDFSENLVPVMSAVTPMGLCPSDNLYADMNGDHVPEMAIGRIPVLTEKELQDVIAKIKKYESSTNKRIILLADDPDDGGKFDENTVDIKALIPSPPYQSVPPIYLPHPNDVNDVASAKTQLIDAMNTGAFLLNYIGHASFGMLASEGLLTINDLESLHNFNGLPVLIAMTCDVGMFAYPGEDTLSEALVLKNDGGVVAAWVPSGLSFNDPASILDKGFFKAVFIKGKKVLGDAILDAMKEYNTQKEGSTYLMDIYNLLGDPALKMR
jgi:uncharacterized repeat protein (TIGR01451 family)